MSQRPETVEKYQTAKQLVLGGETVKDATNQVGLSRPTYQQMRRADPEGINLRQRNAKVGRKLGSKNTPKPSFLDIPLKEQKKVQDEKTIVIVCSSSTLKGVLEGLL